KGQQAPFTQPGFLPTRHKTGQVRTMLQDPIHAALEFGQPVQKIWLDRLNREQRHQPDERPHLQFAHLSGWKVEHVVKKLILLVPEGKAATAEFLEGPRDEKKVPKNFAPQVLIKGVAPSQF